MEVTGQEIDEVVQAALREDVGPGDITSELTIPEGVLGVAEMVAREPQVVAGLGVAEAVWRLLSPAVRVERKVEEGARVGAGAVLMRVAGPARAILTGERVALNFVQRLSGVATLTSRYVEAVAGTGVEILDTRKTTPGLRRLEKYAVTCGGGVNHRMGLYDMVLIKDNHLAALGQDGGDAIALAVGRARARAGVGVKVEVEVDTVEQAARAVEAGPDFILLDNMSLGDLKRSVEIIAGRCRTEASGGVDLSTVREVALTGVSCISVGALTHSARAVDIGLDFQFKPVVAAR